MQSRDKNLENLFEETVKDTQEFTNNLQNFALNSFSASDYLSDENLQNNFTNLIEKIARLKNEFVISGKTFAEIMSSFQKTQNKSLLITLDERMVNGKDFGVKVIPENPHKLLEIMQDIVQVLVAKFKDYKKRNLSNKTKNQIFYINQNDGKIWHYDFYELRSENTQLLTTDYYKLFKLIIEHFPKSEIEMRIFDFIKKLPKKTKVDADKLRSNLGVPGKSFKSFLEFNGVNNLHPKNNKKIIDITHTFIIFNNRI